jgi:hypothetical protein
VQLPPERAAVEIHNHRANRLWTWIFGTGNNRTSFEKDGLTAAKNGTVTISMKSHRSESSAKISAGAKEADGVNSARDRRIFNGVHDHILVIVIEGKIENG